MQVPRFWDTERIFVSCWDRGMKTTMGWNPIRNSIFFSTVLEYCMFVILQCRLQQYKHEGTGQGLSPEKGKSDDLRGTVNHDRGGHLWKSVRRRSPLPWEHKWAADRRRNNLRHIDRFRLKACPRFSDAMVPETCTEVERWLDGKSQIRMMRGVHYHVPTFKESPNATSSSDNRPKNDPTPVTVGISAGERDRNVELSYFQEVGTPPWLPFDSMRRGEKRASLATSLWHGRCVGFLCMEVVDMRLILDFIWDWTGEIFGGSSLGRPKLQLSPSFFFLFSFYFLFSHSAQTSTRERERGFALRVIESKRRALHQSQNRDECRTKSMLIPLVLTTMLSRPRQG